MIIVAGTEFPDNSLYICQMQGNYGDEFAIDSIHRHLTMGYVLHLSLTQSCASY